VQLAHQALVLDGQRVAILAGLNARDRVVTRGAYDIYAASLAGAVESHRH
jgi:hypothetical protein